MTARAAIWRDLVIVACAISAGVHAALVPDHLAEGTAAGVAFGAAAVLLALVAVALTRRPSAAVLAAAAGLFAALIAGYALAVTTGLPLLHPGPEPVDGLAVFTKAVEAVGLAAAVQLLRRSPAALQAAGPRPIPLGLTGLIAVFSVLSALAGSNGHGAHAHGDRPHAADTPMLRPE